MASRRIIQRDSRFYWTLMPTAYDVLRRYLDQRHDSATRTASARAASGDWKARAACRRTDPDLFFPVASSGPAALQVTRAKAVCAQCPVLTDCLIYALATGQDAGVWGGTSEEERREIRSAGCQCGLRGGWPQDR